MDARAKAAKRWLLTGSSGLPVGIALSATGHVVPGAIATLAALAALAFGLHAFGRAGPETDP
jgi:hypothetical protein